WSMKHFGNAASFISRGPFTTSNRLLDLAQSAHYGLFVFEDRSGSQFVGGEEKCSVGDVGWREQAPERACLQSLFQPILASAFLHRSHLMLALGQYPAGID